MEWMAWTWPTGIFFASIFLLLCGMAIGEIRRPTTIRQGWLPIETTRGDRLFIALIFAAFFHLGWLALLDFSQWPALLISLALGVLIFFKA